MQRDLLNPVEAMEIFEEETMKAGQQLLFVTVDEESVSSFSHRFLGEGRRISQNQFDSIAWTNKYRNIPSRLTLKNGTQVTIKAEPEMKEGHPFDTIWACGILDSHREGVLGRLSTGGKYLESKEAP